MSKIENNIQKVHVVNFPEKDKWDKLQIIVTIISLLLATVSTWLYIHEIKKCPDLYVSVFSPTPTLGKVIFEFGDNALSNPLEFDVSLQNKGDKKSESLTKFTLMFDRKVEVSLKSQGLWEEDKESQDFKTFHYLKEDLGINSDTSRRIGKFDLCIPKQAKPLLFAMFIIEGDFKRKMGLIYYDYLNEKYNVVQYTDPHRATEVWNKHLNQ
ncbi:MAG: hypothetical protein ISS71_01495 [Phycisphaerae bacterium]|nr:hypothetical protein [Phycisphaerae bacterium]